MKNSNNRRWGLLFFLWSMALVLSAQQRTVTGTITEAGSMEPIPGAAVVVEGSTRGAVTNIDGQYSISVSDSDTLMVSYLGFQTQRVPVSGRFRVDFELQPEFISFDEVVVIGYGMQRKGDLTGAVSNVSSKDFNQGIIGSPEQLINGKVSGVQITSGGGSPTAGSTIRIRGGASLNASNDPLIVLDGVPLESGGISGNSNNFLSLINPNDIESMTVLKDASATAIYGSRASNGVILITTKKGEGGKTRLNFSTTNSLQMKTKLPEMLSAEEFRTVVNNFGSADQQALLGSQNTNWNDEIYQMAFGTDNNFSMSGEAYQLPYRFSIGYYNQNGILKYDQAERITGSLSLSPALFDDHLKLNLGLKGSLNNNQFAATDAIWAATTFNPTQPVYSQNENFGGYNEAINSDGSPVTSGVINPASLVEFYNSSSTVQRLITNLDINYRFHFLPDLR